ncbi:Asp-tRNA(Asn)/Glu-tRNA(Gln) amidotransferase subunit GatC [Mycoplasmopsis columbinasalis]|uniref:Glutamyl-tRNA(Gln)amidotransferase subunit C n=1 Tax=Mycoplasmopsis columbinasalis TaxID=114880 RepID=A0A449BAC7_9BACT|nr:Asp-tRNA(Asn)/Glu-tRNA(Gln) amidotransferase subunit GatC [Mycoplasmopsis columbinasalis]VEU78138.1 glutamyl-tRNA(gln)amidotransferase subunit C [Mycoplasmopsis columbinasalis]
MLKIDKEKLKSIVASLMLEPSEEVLEGILLEWNDIYKNLKLLDELNLENVEPMTRIDSTTIDDFLRDDIADTTFNINKEIALQNAKDQDDDYIIIKKVVK